MRGEREGRFDEALPVPGAEELLRFLLHLLLFLGDKRHDVVERIERGHARIAGAGERLHRRDDRALDPERLVQWRRGESESDRGAVPVRHDRPGPATFAPLHLEGVHVLGVHLGDEERNVIVHAMGLDVREHVVTGLREGGLPLLSRVGRQRREADLGVEVRARRLQRHARGVGGHLARPVPWRDVAVALARLRIARGEGADLEPGMTLQKADEPLPHGPGRAEDRDLPFTHRGQV